MKTLLKDIYLKNQRDFQIWNYLWIFSDENNSVEFSHSELSGRFNIPISSLYRVLSIYPELWNKDKIIVESERLPHKVIRITFHPKGKRIEKSNIYTVYDEAFDWIKEFYAEIKYDYPDIAKHKKYIKNICDKLEKAMVANNTDITRESLITTLQTFFIKIDDWWRDSGNMSITSINKHFTRILNQIKANKNNNGKKRDSYSKAGEKASSINFDKLARKQ